MGLYEAIMTVLCLSLLILAVFYVHSVNEAQVLIFLLLCTADCLPVSAFTQFVGRQEEYLACKKLSGATCR